MYSMPTAIAVFDGKGTVTFSEGSTWTTITLDLCGLKKNSLHELFSRFEPYNNFIYKKLKSVNIHIFTNKLDHLKHYIVRILLVFFLLKVWTDIRCNSDSNCGMISLDLVLPGLESS